MNINKNNLLQERYVAFTIGVVTAVILAIRVVLLYDDHGGIFNALKHLSQFFTILTNTVVMLLMFAISSGRKIPQLFKLCVVVAITGVGIIYHLLLAHLWSPEGLAWFADQGVHTLVPILTIGWWLMFAIKTKISYKQSFYVVIWPIVYSCYALFRAQFSGVYPYPFLDLETLGWTHLTLNLLGISAAFLLLGLLFITVNNLLLSKDEPTNS